MKPISTTFLTAVSVVLVLLLVCGGTVVVQAQTIEQQLVLVLNQHSLGGQFNVAVQVKGSGLPAANTLGSATIDVQYDNTKLTFVSGTNWAFSGTQGYSRNAGAVAGAMRIAITGGSVNENGGGDPPGFDIASSYTTWVQLNFTIASTVGSTGLTIAAGSNAIGLFANHQNEPQYSNYQQRDPLSSRQSQSCAAAHPALLLHGDHGHRVERGVALEDLVGGGQSGL